MAIAQTGSAARLLACCLLCSACLRFGYAADQRNQAGRSGASGRGEIDAGFGDRLRDAGRGHAPTADADTGDAGVFVGVPDASSGVTDAGAVSLRPPTPIDDAGQPIVGVAGPPVMPSDAGTIAPMPDAGVDDELDSGLTQPECVAGRELAGYCWFLGAVSQSCDAVCAAHGGFIPSLPYIGTRAQGGSLSRCDAVLTLLTGEGDTTAGLREDGRGVGCHLFEGKRWWLNYPSFSSSAFHPSAQLACSCLDK